MAPRGSGAQPGGGAPCHRIASCVAFPSTAIQPGPVGISANTRVPLPLQAASAKAAFTSAVRSAVCTEAPRAHVCGIDHVTVGASNVRPVMQRLHENGLLGIHGDGPLMLNLMVTFPTLAEGTLVLVNCRYACCTTWPFAAEMPVNSKPAADMPVSQDCP